MSSFVQDNLDRFNKIQGDYNNIANSISNLTSRDADNDLKSKIENIGSGVESGANLYMEGRKMIHELRGRNVQKGLVNTLKEAGERNAKHLIKNNNLMSDVMNKLKNQGAVDRNLSTGGGDENSSYNVNKALKGRYSNLSADLKKQVDRGVRGDPRFKAQVQNEDDFKQNLSIAKEQIEKAEGTPAAGSPDPAPPQAPTSAPDPAPAPASTPAPAPQAQEGEAPPSAPDPAPRPRPPPQTESVESSDTDQTAQSLQEPRTISQSQGRVATDDAPASSEGSAGRNLAGGAARTAESGGSTASEAAAGAAAGEEAAGGVLDAIPGLDILGLALGAIGGITSAVAGAVPDKQEQPDRPKPMSIGGNFSQQAVEQGGTTA